MRDQRQRLSIAIDGRVIALAATNPLARTGVFFVTVGFASALAQRDDVDLYIIGCDGLSDEFLSGMTGFPRGSIRPISSPSRPLVFFSTYYPIDAAISNSSSILPVQMVHDLSFHACPELGDRGLEFERHLMRSVTQRTVVVASSQCTRNDVRKYFDIPAERIVVTYEGVRQGWGPYPYQSNEPSFVSALSMEGAVYLLALSTIEPRKNLLTTLKAFSIVCEKAARSPNKMPSVYLVVVGAKGWGDDSAFEADLADHVRAKVIFTGYLPDNELPSTITNALCLIYPSLYEGFGLPVLEAMSLGTPVIVSNRGSLPELVGSDGYLVNPTDAETIAEIVIRLARSNELRSERVTAGYKSASRFSWERSTATLIDHISYIRTSTVNATH
jgi:glycosyltransferase involved in cell wall biosynthesis